MIDLNQEDLAVVREGIYSSFEKEELDSYLTFEDFFADVDVQNAYEEEWEPEKWKPYFFQVWKEFKNITN